VTSSCDFQTTIQNQINDAILCISRNQTIFV